MFAFNAEMKMQLGLRNNEKRGRRFKVIQDYQIKPYTSPQKFFKNFLYSLNSSTYFETKKIGE